MLIGVGPHSKRIYLPLIKRYKEEYNINLNVVVDIKYQKNVIRKYLKEKKFSILDDYYVDYNLEDEFVLNKEDKRHLLKIVDRNKINAIILSTDPLAHKSYINFALEVGLHILMDKPITTKKNASLDSNQAKKIYYDFQDIIKKLYKAEEKNPNIIVSCLSQRRYHPAIKRIKEEIKNVSKISNCPITSIICEHSDGQWRMPNEILSEKYHGFTNGIGKCSHSGYHFFDIMYWLSQEIEEKKYDKIVCYSSFIRPSDWISQFQVKDYKNLFKSDTYSLNISQEDFIQKTQNFGEIDSHIIFTFYKNNYKIQNIQFSLLHNGFSRRSWLKSKKDLYKGNGRVRHEYYSIHQGPFQSIKYESYQSDQIKKNSLNLNGEVGSELHSDVLIFRNSNVLDVDLPHFEKLQFGANNNKRLKGYSRGHQEDARGDCFIEFIKAIRGEIPKAKLCSEIKTHLGSVLLMSLAYLSASKSLNNENSISVFTNVGGLK